MKITHNYLDKILGLLNDSMVMTVGGSEVGHLPKQHELR